MTLARTLPTTSSSEIPRQLSQRDISPFFGMGTNVGFTHTCRTTPARYTSPNSSTSLAVKSGPPPFNISGRVPEAPADLPLRSQEIARLTSRSVDASERWAASGGCGISSRALRFMNLQHSGHRQSVFRTGDSAPLVNCRCYRSHAARWKCAQGRGPGYKTGGHGCSLPDNYSIES